MVRVRATFVVLLLAGFAAAGCLGSDEGDLEGDPQGADDDPDEESSVVLRGRVMDEGLEPVAGATVTLSGNDEVVGDTTSDEEGHYRLTAPEEGGYRVHASSPCCHEEVMGVDLREGENQMNFLLTFFSDDDLQIPRVEVGEWTGMLSCSARLPDGAGYNLPCSTVDPNQDWYRDLEVKEGLRTIVMGMEWDSAGSNLMETLVLRHDKGSVGGSGPTFFRVDGSSPIEVVVGSEDTATESLHFENITESWDTQVGVWAGSGEATSSNVVYQQPFTVYWRLYYWEAATDGASALPS